VRLRSGELRTTGHTRARGRAREAKRSLTAAAGEFPSCVAIWRKDDNDGQDVAAVGLRFTVSRRWGQTGTIRTYQ
jgi:hypothetical protein